MDVVPNDRLRIGILGSQSSPYVRQLERASQARGYAEVRNVAFSDLAAEIDSRQVATNLADLDAVVVRTMPLGSLEQVIFRMDCLQVAQDSGLVVVNSPRCLEVAIDKWLTLHRLRNLQVEVPWTIACQNRDEALEAFEKLGGDVVVKPLFGGEGRGMIRVQDKDMAWRVLSTLQQTRSVMYLQQFFEHFGYDIRVLFVGERHFSIRRYVQDGGWRTNVAQGSRAEPHAINEIELEIARRAARAVGGGVLGVDLLPCKDGRMRVLEVNAVPGWKALSQALQVDVADVILSHVEDLVEQCHAG